MLGRIIEIADEQRFLSIYRGFMVVKDTSGTWQELARIPLDDITAVIANSYGLSYTNNLLVGLAERCTPLVVCGVNHNAVGMLLPIEGNYQQAKRFDAQIAASKPTRKRLWAEIVRAKLERQAAVLKKLDIPHMPIVMMAKKVRSGDPENFEAQAARQYWGLLFGSNFRRDRSANGVNALLNYGYTILRACTARAVVAAGLHPTLGIHHSNENNAMRLVDDLMEPFRPLIDLKVQRLLQAGQDDVTPATKRALVYTLYHELKTDAGLSPVMVCIERLANSLTQVYLQTRNNIDVAETATLPKMDEEVDTD